jgi:hypothetical protein
MPFQSFDCLDYSATRAPGQNGQKPFSSDLGMVPMFYLGNGFYDGPADAAKVNAAGAHRLGRGLPKDATVLLDLEPWLHRMIDWSGRNLAPHPNRDRFAAAIARTVYLIRSACPSAKIGTYQSIIGTFHPDNDPAWLRAYRDTNDAVFVAPFPGAPNGIGNLFDAAVVSFYRCYSDDALNRRRIDGLASEARRLYPHLPLWSTLWARYPQSYQALPLRFDYMTRPHVRQMIELSRQLADSEIWWGSNLYGRPGLSIADRNEFGYAREGGDGWDPNATWWQEAQQWLAVPKVETTSRDAVIPFRRREDRHA